MVGAALVAEVTPSVAEALAVAAHLAEVEEVLAEAGLLEAAEAPSAATHPSVRLGARSGDRTQAVHLAEVAVLEDQAVSRPPRSTAHPIRIPGLCMSGPTTVATAPITMEAGVITASIGGDLRGTTGHRSTQPFIGGSQ